jgi:hypothetical protein
LIPVNYAAWGLPGVRLLLPFQIPHADPYKS